MPNSLQSPAVMRVIIRLQTLGKQTAQQDDGWLCQCPAHDDSNPSFAVTSDGGDGKVLMVCRAGCLQSEVITALGLPAKALFLTSEEKAAWAGGRGYTPASHVRISAPEKKLNTNNDVTSTLGTALQNTTSAVDDRNSSGDGNGHQPSETPSEDGGLTLDDYAAAKQLPKDFLQRVGLTTVYLGGLPVISLPFKDAEGIVRAVQFRRAMKKGDHEDGRFLWSRKGTKPLLYGLWRTESLSKAIDIVIVEGASDCHTLWLHDIPALGLPGAGSWKDDWAKELDGYERIFIVREPDKGGEAVEDWVTSSSIRHRVSFIDLGARKDPSGLYLDNQAQFRERWDKAVADATSWAEAYHAGMLRDVKRLYGTIEPLLNAKDLLDQLRQAIHDMGYVGDPWPAILVYLTLTSRLLDRPMNGAVIGPPSVGKNMAVDVAREFLPPEEFHAFEASSPLALIYDDADLKHKAVLVGELDSLPDDGPAGSAIRSLAQNNQTTYDVVEKDGKTGKFRTRRICREGPTVLLTTGTKSPAPQLQTRMLEIHLQDDPQLTHDILARQAEEAGVSAPKKPDLQPWRDLQKWLALQTSEVRIPFAQALASALRDRIIHPPTRLRRDHPKLLTCIKTIALLYQCQRGRAPGGDLLATLQDYEEARKLLEPVFGTIVNEGVTSAVRSTVAGVAALVAGGSTSVTDSALATHLNLSKTAARYRVRRCLTGGWLVNEETRKGRPAQLVIGAPLPGEASILPSVEEVMQAWGADAPGIAQSVNNALVRENDQDVASAEEDRASDKIVAHPIAQSVNNALAMENGDGATGLVTPPESTPPLPPPWEDDEVEESGGLNTSGTDEQDMSNGPLPVEMIEPEPDSQQPSSEMLSSPSVEVGASFECPSYTYITEASQLERVLPDILAARTMGLDTETTGLDPLTDKLCLVQLATPDHVYVVNVLRCPVEILAPMLHGDRWLIGHNLKFDLKSLVQAGLPWPTAKLLDTQLSAQVLGAGKTMAPKGTYTLEALVEKYLQRAVDKALQVSDWGQPTLSREQLLYAAIDAQVLLPLADVFTKELREDRLWATATLESTCALAFAAMELAGMPVDVKAWEAQAERQSFRAKKLREELTALTGQSINWNSWQQVLPILQGRGIPVESTNNDVLIPYVGDDVVVKLLEYRQASKAEGTYGLKWLAHVHPKTGRVHSDFFPLGTTVGRSSASEPNVQNLPRDVAYRASIRVEDDRRLIKADYSQLHLRIASVMAPDRGMQEAFQQGVDLHRRTAAGLLHKEAELATPDDRQLAKALNFGLIYSMGARRLQKQAWTDYEVRLTEVEAQAHKDAWFTLYPGIRKWHNREQHAISIDRITETRSYKGRRRTGITYLPDRLSSPVLGTEADGMKAAMVALFTHQNDFPRATVVNCIHDELLVECDSSEAEAVAQWVQVHMERAMQDAVKEKTATPVEVHCGQTWAG